MKTYKGFNSKMKCRGFQYETGKTYEHKGDIKICHEGFHAISEVESPLSVFNYYTPADEDGNMSRYCEVEPIGETIYEGDKLCCKKLKIGAEIGIPGIVKAHIEWVKKNLIDDNEHKSTNTGFQSAATNTGDRSAATNTGFQSAATNTGDRSAATNTGFQSAATNTGDQSAATNTGDQSAAEVSGEGSVAAVFGIDSMVRGSIGCAIFGVERGEWNGKIYPIISVCSAIVDGKKIKADTWYKVKEGKFVEAK